MSDQLLAFMDVETLGLSAVQHRVIEVGLCIVPEDDWTDLKVESFPFRPTLEDMACAQKEALNVNGYHPGHPRWLGAPLCSSPEAARVWETVRDRVRGCKLANQNVGFDQKFAWAELCRHKVPRHDCVNDERTPYSHSDDCKVRGPWHTEAFEVRQYSNAFAKNGGLASKSLGPVYEYLGGPKIRLHEGATDVLAAMWIYAHGKALIDRVGSHMQMVAAIRKYIADNNLEIAPSKDL